MQGVLLTAVGLVDVIELNHGQPFRFGIPRCFPCLDIPSARPDVSWIPPGSMKIHPSGFDYGLFRPPLRASLERVQSTLSNPATKIFNLLRVLIHESKRFVNNAG
jgi:hypothetical protein